MVIFAAEAKREKKLAITEALYRQAQELRYLCADLEFEEGERTI
jgi:hypothetical protein